MYIDSLSISKNEILCFLGENGAGKTTLLSILAFLLKPKAGEIYYENQKVKSLKEIRGKVTMVFQRPVLFQGTVYENITFPFKWLGKNLDKEKLEFFMEKFGISKIKDKKAKNISEGEAQRTSLVRALILKPKVLILDEPFSSIDLLSFHDIISEVIKIAQSEETTLIFSTHRAEEAAHAERVGIISEGKIIQLSKFEEVLFQPVNDKVAGLLGSINVIKGKIIEWKNGIAKVRSGEKEIEAVTEIKDGKVFLFLRPENVLLSKELPHSSARNIFKCSIINFVNREVGMEIVLDCGFIINSFITRPSFENLNLKVGEEIYAFFKASSLHAVRE